MTKQQAIEQLRAAKAAHIRWRSYAQALIAGVEVDESKIPVVHTDCVFGKWYYGAGQELAYLPSFRAIEEPHQKLHIIYMKIFKLLFQQEEVSFFQKLTGVSSKLARERRQEVQEALDSLVAVSRSLLEMLEVLERDVINAPAYSESGFAPMTA